MTKQQAISLLANSEVVLRKTREALLNDDIIKAKEYYFKVLNELDNTCAIQMDDLQ